MKVQCPCGTKYVFDVTPEMAQTPVQLVCQTCGLDISEPVNQLIREELAAGTESSTSPATAAQPAMPPPLPQPQAARKTSAVHVRVHAAGGAGDTSAVAAVQPCLKHPGELVVERCRVCGSWLCPKCMELFGYVCSPLCREKARARGLEIPVYANQRDVVQARFWRKVWLGLSAAAAVAIAILGLWFWYAWFGSVPRLAFSVRFDELAESGRGRLVGPDQLVFLHGGRLARHDLKAKKEVWSQMLIDKQRIRQLATIAHARMKAAYERMESESDAESLPGAFKLPSLDEMFYEMHKAAAAALELYVSGENVWVASPDKLTRHDWQSGRVTREIPLNDGAYQIYPRGQELLLVCRNWRGRETVGHLNLVSGDMRSEEISGPKLQAAGAPPAPSAAIEAIVAEAFRAANKPVDPDAVAARAQKLPLAARLALPALLAAGANQQRALAELRGGTGPATAPPGKEPEQFAHTTLIPDQTGFVQLSVQLLESRFVERQAMKDRPKTSAFDGPINQAATPAIANEILNEMQRDRGGATVTENISRYQVTLRRVGAGDAPDWTGEVIGPPQLYPLRTVNVLASSKMITVFDKSNRKLWESKLNYDIPKRSSRQTTWKYGDGPCVERGDTLYVFDQGVLSAFDKDTGAARWRLPTVGVGGLFFDDRGMIYVNTTTASPDSIKYSRQIDVTEKKSQVILKVDPKTGKQLWRTEAEGWINYLSGKFIYTVESYQADEQDTGILGTVTTGFEIPSHVRIKRIDPAKGKVLWEHYQTRCPLDVQFEKNSILLLFRKELQILKFVSL